MSGPVRYCSQWGIAFEPHLQNVYVTIRDGLPSRIVLRDLDASILDPRRIRPVLRDLDLDLAEGTGERCQRSKSAESVSFRRCYLDISER